MTRTRTWSGLLLLSGLMLMSSSLAGCSDDDNKNPMLPSGDETAMLRVVHAAVGAPAVDVYVNGGDQPVVQALAYGAASGYLEVPAGDYTVQLRAHGAAASSAPVFTTGMQLPAAATVTAVAAGLLGSTHEGDRFRILPLVEGFAAPGTGNAAVRVVHAAADAPTVALDIGNDGAPEVTGFARFADTGAAGVPLPAGASLRVGVWAGDPLARASVFTTPQLPAGANLFLIATGLLAGDPQSDGFSLLAIGPSGSLGFIRQDARATVHVLHASPDAPGVDLDANGAQVAAGLAFGALSDAVVIWPGAYVVDVRAAGTPTVAASLVTPYLEPGVSYLAIATGFLAGGVPGFQLLPLADAFAGGAAEALVRVVHASPDAPAVDVGPVVAQSVTAVADFTGLSFGEASRSAGTALPIGALTVGIAAAGTATPVASFDLVTAEGLRAFAVASGSLGGVGQSLRLVLVVVDEGGWSAIEVLPKN